MSNSIETFFAQGSDLECGLKVGKHYQEMLHNFLAMVQKELTVNTPWEVVRNHAQKFLPASVQHFPHIIDQLRGIASGSGLLFEDIFALASEETYDTFEIKKCTDLVVTNPYPIIAHNNDAGSELLPFVSVVTWNTYRGSTLEIGLGPFMSVGVTKKSNGDVIALSGNELSQNDCRDEGIPRWIIALAILDAKDLTEALTIANHPERASSYNNIIADYHHVVCFEGSATNHRIVKPDEYGHIVHTNHYTEEMTPYDKEPDDGDSTGRLIRAQILLDSLVPEQPIVPQLKKILRDHGPENIPSEMTICKHDGKDHRQHTTFSTVIDMGTGTIEIAIGPPCSNDYHVLWQFRN